MKSGREILTMLIDELIKRIDNIQDADRDQYYNKFLGDISFLLAGLLQSHLNSFDNWDRNKWFDDSLLTNVIIQNEQLIIEGIMIWGKENTNKQWTEPFYFEIFLSSDKLRFKEYTFFFSDKNKAEIPYEQFSENRDYWDGDNDRSWKYIINQKIS